MLWRVQKGKEMKLKLDRSEWKLVGHFGVSAGLCWIGDPCYILHTENGLPKTLGKDWGDFCNGLGEDYPTLKSYGYEAGHEGLGICVDTGFGDGSYPVYARVTEEAGWGKRVAQIFIDFMGDAFGDDEEEEVEEDEPLELCSECREPVDENGNCTNEDCREYHEYEQDEV